jgi:hypothetical protein
MPTIVIRLDPQLLSNPDLDIRYALPELLNQRSNGLINDGGYDYTGPGPFLMLFLETSETKASITCILDVIENIRVMDNDLGPAAVVAIQKDRGNEVVFPADFNGVFEL